MGDIGPARQHYDVLPSAEPRERRDAEPVPAAGPVVERHDTPEPSSR